MDASVIIPSFNGAPLLRDCLESLYSAAAAPGIGREILVVDNGSTDHTRQLLAEEYPGVRLIALERNTGFTGGVIAGAEAATGGILVFLNNDTRVDPEWLVELLAPLDDPAIAAVGSVLLNAEETRLDFGGASANLFGWGFQSGHGESPEALDETLRPQFFLCGGAMAIRRPIYTQLGGFDPDYFAFFEDVDLGWRLNLAGFKAVLNPASRVAHQQSATAKTMPVSLRAFLTERNALRTMVKNLSDANLAELLPWACALAIERTIIDFGLERDRFFAGRWGEAVFGRGRRGGTETLREELSELKESGKRVVKERLLHQGNQEERGQARLLAIEAVLTEWPGLLAKRAAVQALRKVGDRDLMPLMQDLLRAPLGHPREQAILSELQAFLARRGA